MLIALYGDESCTSVVQQQKKGRGVLRRNPEFVRVLGSTWGCSGEGMINQNEAQGRGSSAWWSVCEPSHPCLDDCSHKSQKEAEAECWLLGLTPSGSCLPREPHREPKQSSPDFQSPSMTRVPFSLIITLYSFSGEIFQCVSPNSVMLYTYITDNSIYTHWNRIIRIWGFKSYEKAKVQLSCLIVDSQNCRII